MKDFVYDASNIIPGTALPAGALDFPLMSSSFAGFSDLDYRTITQTVGANFRATNNVLVNSTLSFGDLNDAKPFLYDTTGSRVGFYVGHELDLLTLAQLDEGPTGETGVPLHPDLLPAARAGSAPRRYFSIFGFHTFQTLPDEIGAGLERQLSGLPPAGVASVPLLARTCWKAWIWRTDSANLRPTGGVSTSMRLDHAVRVDDEATAQLDALVLVPHAEGAADVAGLVGRHVEGHAALDHLDQLVVVPHLVDEVAVHADGDDLDAQLLQHRVLVGDRRHFRRSDEGEVAGVEAEQHPLAQVVRELDVGERASVVGRGLRNPGPSVRRERSCASVSFWVRCRCGRWCRRWLRAHDGARGAGATGGWVCHLASWLRGLVDARGRAGPQDTSGACGCQARTAPGL